METSTQYREFAEECERLATQAKTTPHQKFWKKWRRFGESSQRVRYKELILFQLFIASGLIFCQTKPDLRHLYQYSPYPRIIGGRPSPDIL